MLNRSKLWAAGLLFAAFAVGVGVGGAVTSAWGVGDGRADNRGRGPDGRDRGRRMSYAERLQADLGLTADQRAAVDSILEQEQTELRLVWQEMRPRFDTLREGIRRDITHILDEEQQAKYRELIERSDRRREREREGDKRSK